MTLTALQKRRAIFLGCSLFVCGCGLFFLVQLFQKEMIYYQTPFEMTAHACGPEGVDLQPRRLGGYVQGPIDHHDRDAAPYVTFRVTDGRSDLSVRFSGVLPDLFRVDQGVVVEGVLAYDPLLGQCYFQAHHVLAKHDENYRVAVP